MVIDWSTLIDSLDKSFGYVATAKFVIGAIIAVVVVYAIYRTRRLIGKASEIPSIMPVDVFPNQPEMTQQDKLAKFMSRESARYIAESMEVKDKSMLKAFENAVLASVTSRLAKDLATDTGKLSEDLGVDLNEYVTYTSQVLQETKTRLQHKYQGL